MSYCIKPSYAERENVPHFDDTPFKDEFQDEVYEFASKLAKPGMVIMDYGCGSGFKLIKWFENFCTIGFEVEPTLTWLEEKYPARHWMQAESLFLQRGDFDSLMVCSDVIEHVDDPDQFLQQIISLKPGKLVISTPDRDQLGLNTEDGPPRNRHHVREWNHEEFVEYISQRFVVQSAVRGKITIVECTIKEEVCT